MRYLLFVLLLFGCGNTAEKTYVENPFKATYEEEEIGCMGQACATHKDCTCPGADVCIPSAASMDPEIGDNTNICTIVQCDPNVPTSCPPSYRCYELPMGNSLFKDALTACILEHESP